VVQPDAHELLLRRGRDDRRLGWSGLGVLPTDSAAALRDRLEQRLFAAVPDAVRNGDPAARLPHLANVSFPYVEGESLIMGIKEIAVSSGSACTSASLEPSYVLKGLGLGDELAHSSIRFSLGRFTTEAEVDFAADRVVHEVKRLREMSPLWEMVQEGVDLSKVKWTVH
jgi:cysteine desulfurase